MKASGYKGSYVTPVASCSASATAARRWDMTSVPADCESRDQGVHLRSQSNLFHSRIAL